MSGGDRNEPKGRRVLEILAGVHCALAGGGWGVSCRRSKFSHNFYDRSIVCCGTPGALAIRRGDADDLLSASTVRLDLMGTAA